METLKHILLIDCPDEKGLIHRITKVLLDFKLNVTHNGEFVDIARNHFFMRSELDGDFDKNQLLEALKQVLPFEAVVRISKQEKKNIVILATKEYHCLGDLLIRHSFADLNANILAVISNHENLRLLSERFELPFHYIPHKGLSRETHEQQVIETIDRYTPDFLVLAKYMRILTPAFTQKYPYQMINIHHSFLPAFIGANPYRQAYERGVKIIGATAHFVTDNLDEGPIIMQDVIRTDHSKDYKHMARAGRDVEKIVLANALKLVFEDRVFVSGNKTVIFD